MARFNFFKYFLLTSLLLFFLTSVQADTTVDFSKNIFPTKTVYFGVNLGGGTTEWSYLVDTTDGDQVGGNTPVHVTEGGPSWGVAFGYDVSKNFDIELQYMQFANSNIDLGENSQYTDQNGNSITNIVSKTQAYSLSGKFLAQVGHTHLRAFASVGAGVVVRSDPLVGYHFTPSDNPPLYGSSNYTGKNSDVTCVTPYLSSGLVYSFTRHWMLESGFQYYTGFGQSNVYPVGTFIPFAWDAYGRLSYQI